MSRFININMNVKNVKMIYIVKERVDVTGQCPLSISLPGARSRSRTKQTRHLHRAIHRALPSTRTDPSGGAIHEILVVLPCLVGIAFDQEDLYMWICS